jgi:cytochrome P450
VEWGCSRNGEGFISTTEKATNNPAMKLSRQPPGPSAFEWGNISKVRNDIIGFFRECLDRYGDIVTVRVGPTRRVLIQNPEYIELMLSRQSRGFVKPYLLRSTRMLGNGLLSSDGQVWIGRRRLAQPFFKEEATRAYSEILLTQCDAMLALWADQDSRDVYRDFKRLALETIARTTFGEETGPFALDTLELFSEAFERFGERVKSPLPLPDRFPTPGNLKLLKAIRKIDAQVFEFIRERRANRRPDRTDFLSRMVEAQAEEGSNLSDRDIRDEIASLVAAGHDANAAVLTWAAYLLAENGEWQKHQQAEVDSLLGGRRPQFDDLRRLRITGAIVLEAMRMFPPVWVFGREPLEDTDMGGFRIPKGTSIIVCQYLLHRDPRFFKNPDQFLPERWLGSEPHFPYAFVPFGAGPRRCIGESMAMMESVLTLARVAQSFQFARQTAAPPELATNLTLIPKGGMRLTLQRRVPGMPC